jgi:hypothetical protein
MTAPNIVFILADDLGWADLGVYGATDFKTRTWTASPPRACAQSGLCQLGRLLGHTHCADHRALSVPASGRA